MQSLRNRKLAAIHLAKKKLALDEILYRQILEDITGKKSAADCTDQELSSVLSRLKGVESDDRTNPLNKNGFCTAAQKHYIQGLWKLASRSKTERALRTVIKRISGIDDLRFLPKAEATKVILALRDIAHKAGFNPDQSPKEG